MKKGYILVFIFLIATMGCKSNQEDVRWPDIIKINDIIYTRNTYITSAETSDMLIDEVIGKTTQNLSLSNKSANYQIQNGDAGNLPIGTIIYSLEKYDFNKRVAVLISDNIIPFEASINPIATIAGDIIALDNLKSIILTSHKDGTTVLGAIENESDIKDIHNSIYIAPVKETEIIYPKEHCFIKFYYLDGSSATYSYFIEDGVLGKNIVLDKELKEVFKKILTNK